MSCDEPPGSRNRLVVFGGFSQSNLQHKLIHIEAREWTLPYEQLNTNLVKRSGFLSWQIPGKSNLRMRIHLSFLSACRPTIALARRTAGFCTPRGSYCPRRRSHIVRCRNRTIMVVRRPRSRHFAVDLKMDELRLGSIKLSLTPLTSRWRN